MSKSLQAIDTIQKQTELITALHNELYITRNLLARLLKDGKQRVVRNKEYNPADSMQFEFSNYNDEEIMIEMKDKSKIVPLKSDYQRILELMEILEL